MHYTTIFALFVGIIAIVHFLNLIVERFESKKSEKRKGITKKRKNWYCFFSPDVLYGEEKLKGPVARDIRQDTIRNNRQRHLQEKRRPALRI